MPEERQNITIYTIVYTASDVDRGSFPIRQAQNSYLSLTAARAEWERKVAEEKAELDDRYDCEEQGDNYWEMYQDGYAAACFSRIEILTTTLYCEGGE